MKPKNRFCLGGGKVRATYISFRTTNEIKVRAEKLAKKEGANLSAYMEGLLLRQLDKHGL